MTTDVSTHTRTDRAELIADLRAFADMLERFPHLPADRWMSVRIQHSVLNQFGDAEARIKEVVRVAALLGVEPEIDEQRASAQLECGQVLYTIHTRLGGDS